MNGASVRCAAAKTVARRHNTCDHGSWLASEAFAPLRCTTQSYFLKKASAPCNRASSASINETSVRCMDAAWRGADGSSTQQPKLYDCRRSSTCSDGFTTNVACRRSFRCSALHHKNLLRSLLHHVRDECSFPPKHSLLCAALRCSALLCAALRCTTQTY